MIGKALGCDDMAQSWFVGDSVGRAYRSKLLIDAVLRKENCFSEEPPGLFDRSIRVWTPPSLLT